MPYNQQLEATTYSKSTFTTTMKNSNELDSLSRISLHRSGPSSNKILLSQPLFNEIKSNHHHLNPSSSNK
ncbi:hypothetical protein SFC34_08360 [Priestia aryabhattai]|uniref:hypothetical protein n=1 Tax=Priestia aryabhattai TaxID=412384 RepID=UPI001113B411|nr:hypothetical protein [Priestia aryabhattai]MED4154775.1 hypothetical protein [Priestia aryabhattai]